MFHCFFPFIRQWRGEIATMGVRVKRSTLLPSLLSFSLVSSPVPSTAIPVGTSVFSSSFLRPSHRRGDEMRIFSTLNLQFSKKKVLAI